MKVSKKMCSKERVKKSALALAVFLALWQQSAYARMEVFQGNVYRDGPLEADFGATVVLDSGSNVTYRCPALVEGQAVFAVGRFPEVDDFNARKNSKFNILDVYTNRDCARGLYFLNVASGIFEGENNITKNNGSYGKLFNFASSGDTLMSPTARFNIDNIGPGDCMTVENNARFHKFNLFSKKWISDMQRKNSFESKRGKEK